MIATVTVLGCEERPAASPTGETAATGAEAASTNLVIYSNGEATSLRVEGNRAWGPSVEIERMGDGYRGTWRGRVVDLHLDPDKNRIPTASWATCRSTLPVPVSSEDGTIKAAGLVGGDLSNFEVSDDHITGRVAHCAYDMKRKSPDKHVYGGYISCGGGPSPRLAHHDPAEHPRAAAARAGNALRDAARDLGACSTFAIACSPSKEDARPTPSPVDPHVRREAA